jgi:hypothetical protein
MGVPEADGVFVAASSSLMVRMALDVPNVAVDGVRRFRIRMTV